MKNAAVIGMGTMGPGIAATLARGGLAVRAFDTSAEALEKAGAAAQMASGVLDNLGMEQRGTVHPITYHGSLEEALEGADLVVETVPEKLEIKTAVFREIDGLAPKALLVSNTSGIPITKLQEAVGDPSRVVGMHWSNPPHVIPMIEVIAGKATAKATVDAMCDLIKGMGLLPVVVKKDVPGFVENRVLYAIMRESLALVEDGVIEPEGLDTCVQWGIGYKLSVIGPMALLDMAGLDIYQAVGSYLNADLDNRADVSAVITEKAAKGNLGMKTGSGMFSYTPEEIQSLRMARAKKLVSVRKALESS
jgi:5-formyl-3-hydroxy-2-methylpyridine 4-carboxylate dehydrogenase